MPPGVSPQSMVLLLAILVGASFTFPEAVEMARWRRSLGLAVSLWARRSLLRAAAVALLAQGLVALASCTGGIVWHDLDKFLMRPEHIEAVATLSWTGAWLRAGLGAAAVAVTFPPAVAWATGLVLAATPLHAWWVTASLVPLQPGRAEWLWQPAAGLAALGVALAVVARRRAERLSLAWTLPRGLVRLALATLVLLALEARLAAWLGCGRTVMLAAASGLLAAGATALVVRVARRPSTAFGARLMAHDGVAWSATALLVVLWQGGLLLSGWSLVLTQGEAQLDQLALDPGLLSAAAQPTLEDWRVVAEQLTYLGDRYGGHPWCGRHLLLASWVETTRLGQTTRGRLTLGEAAARYRRVRAVAPPGWPALHTVGAIGRAVLEEWGPLVDPGARPG